MLKKCLLPGKDLLVDVSEGATVESATVQGTLTVPGKILMGKTPEVKNLKSMEMLNRYSTLALGVK